MVQVGYLGLDVGTQAMKAVVIDEAGRVLWSHAHAYPTTSPQPGWSEQNPGDWLDAYGRIMEALEVEVRSLDIRGVGFTGQMHSMVVSDDKGRWLRPAILWSDGRAAAYADSIRQQYGADRLRAMTGNELLSNFSVLALLWIREHEPRIYHRIHKVELAKDWVRNAVTGSFYTDVSDASGTYLFNVRERQWHRAWMDILCIPHAWWGRVAESTAVVGILTRGPKRLQGIPVVAGAGDQEASALGSGLRAGQDLGISLGTSGVLFWPTREFCPAPHRSVHSFCHALSGEWHWMSVTQSAALSMRWFRDAFYPKSSFEEIEGGAKAALPGAQGLFFFPYLQGERAPITNPSAQGTLMGLRPEHTWREVARSVMEGVVFSLFHAWLVMELDAPGNMDRIVATGGGTQSQLWMTMLASVFNHQIIVVDDRGAAVGAAVLALRGVDAAHAGEYTIPARNVVDSNDDTTTYSKLAKAYIQWAEGLNALWTPPTDVRGTL